MPAALANLYCTPADVFDFMSVEGVQVRLDDEHHVFPQTISVLSGVTAGATAVPVAPLTAPLLAGTVLEFTGDMDAAVEARLSTAAAVGSTTLSTLALTSALPADAAAEDNGVNAVLASRLLKGCRYGTSQVKLYCCSRYDDSELVKSWSANRWATALASRWVGRRVCRPCPDSIEKEAKEALDELMKVRTSMLNIEDIGTRDSAWPFITNATVDIRYNVAKVRVQPSISEGTPARYPQYVDWNSVFMWEY